MLSPSTPIPMSSSYSTRSSSDGHPKASADATGFPDAHDPTHAPDGRVRVFDTTLRDGEQAPGCAMRPAAKVRIAKQLHRLGVDVIEAGFPASSPAEFAAVRSIARTVAARPTRP